MSRFSGMNTSITTSSDVALNGLADGQSLVYDASTKKWKNGSSGGASVQDATSTSKGVIQLAGDLGGTATAPMVAAGKITESKLDTGLLRGIDCVIRWDGTGSQPLRSTGTSDSLRPVRWRQSTAPPVGNGYAISGLDVWEQTP